MASLECGAEFLPSVFFHALACHALRGGLRDADALGDLRGMRSGFEEPVLCGVPGHLEKDPQRWDRGGGERKAAGHGAIICAFGLRMSNTSSGAPRST